MNPEPAVAALAALVAELPEDLREQALTHSSWTERRVDSYERLAFLGDSVLGLAVATDVFARFAEVDAGGLTKIHNQAVSGVACAEVGRRLGVPEMLRGNEPEGFAGRDPGRGPARRRAAAAGGDRGADRRLLSRLRLRAHGGGGRGRLRAADRARGRDQDRLQVGPAGAAGPARRTRKLRGDRSHRTAAPPHLRGRGDRRLGARSGPARAEQEGGRAGRGRAGAEAARRLGRGELRVRLNREPRRCRSEESMYLKSITMKGFKSFPERAKLEFSPGVSVIVGPNGSGKSNITDAVLWALGEQSPGAIRGASMQDVISAGGKGIGQRRAAEVEVVIDNSDGRAATEFSEIAVQRRLDRSGDGAYRLNGARCRLADVVEVLSDTNLGREMHSVISQGRVESIVHSKPRERRLLVEEAAGLGKHRKRRRRAELKLRAARDNLDRALDVEREARARLRPLKRQAQAAELGRPDRARGAGPARTAGLRGAALRRRPRRRGGEGGGEGPRGPDRDRGEAGRGRQASPRGRGALRRPRPRAHPGLGPADQAARRAGAGRGPRRRPLRPRDRARCQARVAARRARPADPRRRPRQRSRPSGPASWRRSWARSTPASTAAAEGLGRRPLRRRRRVGPRGRPRRRPQRRRAGLPPRPPRRGPAGRAPPRGAAQAGRRRRGAARRRARRRWPRSRRPAPRSAPGSSAPRARSSAARATATRSPRRCAPAPSRSSSCRRR